MQFQQLAFLATSDRTDLLFSVHFNIDVPPLSYQLETFVPDLASAIASYRDAP